MGLQGPYGGGRQLRASAGPDHDDSPAERLRAPSRVWSMASTRKTEPPRAWGRFRWSMSAATRRRATCTAAGPAGVTCWAPGAASCTATTRCGKIPRRNIRLFGVLRRDSKEWKALYCKRQTIERTFKSMKLSRRLERHCTRGLRMVRLHALMSALAYQATALAAVRAGELETMRWMVWKVAKLPTSPSILVYQPVL